MTGLVWRVRVLGSERGVVLRGTFCRQIKQKVVSLIIRNALSLFATFSSGDVLVRLFLVEIKALVKQALRCDPCF